MAFQESVEGIPNNTNYNISLPRRKRRKTSINTDTESALPSINKNVAPTKYNQIIKPNSVPSRFLSLYDLWLLFRKWNSVDQTVPIFSGWLLNMQKKHSRNLIKQQKRISHRFYLKLLISVQSRNTSNTYSH